ncbi:MAG: pilus assembly protein TadG-related protein [Candidatus Binataceae bacterium]
MRARQREAGQAVVLVVVMLAAILGFAALAVDIGFFENTRRQMQAAADSAALAGTHEILAGYDASITSAAQNDASLNGFTQGSNNVTVTVNNPPKSGSYTTDSQAVEVIISKPQPTFFLLGLGMQTVNLSARAVAIAPANSGCIYALDPTKSGAFDVTGNVTVQSACGLLVNSSSSSGLKATGNITVNTPTSGVVGNYSLTGNVTFNPPPIAGIPPVSDPLAYVQAPAVGGCNYTNYSLSGNNTKTLSPGVYCGGISLVGNNTITLNPGTYILDGGGFSVTGNLTLSGTGVTIYNTAGFSAYGPIALSGNDQVNLSAPTSGAMEGILFFQDRSISSSSSGSTIVGNSSSTFDGAIYFPTTAVTYVGNSSVSGYTLLVGDSISVTGNSTIGNNYSSLANGDPIRTAVLAE